MAATELREDIAAAKAALRGSTLGSGREIKKLTNHLMDGEPVKLLATGTYAGGQGLLALTDRRLLFVLDGVMRQATEDFAFDRITSVQWKSGMLTGTVQITVGGARTEITNVYKDDGKVLVEALRDIVAQVAEEASVQAPAAAAAPDVYEQLRKLGELRDSGILTEAEFDAKKADLVSRI